MRVVFDTNTVVSALLFKHGRLSWLRDHWPVENVAVLVSRATVDELIRVLAYPKFKLNKAEIEALLAEYIPFAEPVEVSDSMESPQCSDLDDQMFINLALAGNADVLVTGDHVLLEMNLEFEVEQPSAYRKRVR